MKRMSVLFVALLLFTAGAYAQKINLPEITLKDFEPKAYRLDSSAQAVILYNGGTATYESNNAQWFNVIYTYHKRVRLLNKNAFNLATVQIPLFKGQRGEDRILKIEAVTYNPENGKVEKTVINKESLFKDKVAKQFTVEKFTFPNLKEGCIIDYTYSIESPVTNYLRPWNFQESFPVLKSEYSLTLPELFNFALLTTGYYELEASVTKSSKYFSIYYYDPTSFIGNTAPAQYFATLNTSSWKLENIPALIKENYTTTLSNHISKIEFQLRTLNFPNSPPQMIMNTWEKVAETLLKDEGFGAGLSLKNNWLEDDLDKLVVKNDLLTTAKNIYRFAAENFNCIDDEATYMSGSLKDVHKAKKGNVADINLLLTAMLRKADIVAEPVLLSTRLNGYASEAYPIMNKFNYVIVRAVINNKEYVLDASDKKIGFNHLPRECYNGSGRIISDKPYLIDLSPDSLKEMKNTVIFLYNDEKEKGRITGTFSSTLGYYESYDLRKKISSTGKDEFSKSIKSSFGYDAVIDNVFIDSLNRYDERAALNFNFSFNMDEDIIYFNPLFSESNKENPFRAATRLYPVEMPYVTDELITIVMEIPAGYTVDELPKSIRVTLNENEGSFEYIARADEEQINLRCRIKINKATFYPEDYETLRDFYGQVVKKQGEQIVFKKKK